MVINQILRGALRSLRPTLQVDTGGYRVALTHSWPFSLFSFTLQLLELLRRFGPRTAGVSVLSTGTGPGQVSQLDSGPCGPLEFCKGPQVPLGVLMWLTYCI